jgi:serine protease Do
MPDAPQPSVFPSSDVPAEVAAPVPTALPVENVPALTLVPASSSFAPHVAPSPAPIPVQSVPVAEPVNAHRATNPLLSMLAGALLSAGLLGAGIAIGRSGGGASGAVTSGSGDYSGPNPVAQVAREVGPAVMNVDTTFGKTGKANFLPRPGQAENIPERKGKGTGFVFDTKNGYMLTNAHVAAGAKELQVTTREGRKITGKVLGYDRESDIAVVQLADKTLPQVKLATFKDPKKLEIGDWTVAIGNPFGQENTVTVGVLSATGRKLPVPPGEEGPGFELTDMLQTDTAINPGNSGGPLINLKGEVIGINTAIIPYGQGLGFSIPINKAKRVADQIIAHGKVFHPYIGVSVKSINDALKQDYGLPDKNGALVQTVAPDSPASKAGLRPGDVVRSLDGKPVKSNKEFVDGLAGRKVGDTVKIEILRNGSIKQTLNMKVGDKPEQ